MPLLPKKPRDAKQAAQAALAWHPNFRNFERLPDTKTVRTAFFINIVAVTVTLILLIVSFMREMDVRALVAQTDDLQTQITKDEPGSKQTLERAGKFETEEKKLRELAEFVGPGKFVLSDFILHLGEQLPGKIALTHVEYRRSELILRGHARGAPDEAAGEADAYIRQLRADLTYGVFFEDISASNQGTNLTMGWYDFDLTLKFKDTQTKENKDKDKEAKK
ncbi:MAG: hypothetical protein WCL04_01710 [Verrucomicrobiota bacterium]